MPTQFYLALAAILMFLTACKAPEGPVKLSGDVPEATGWQMQTILEGLEHPWAITWLNDTDMLITERPGRLRWVQNGVLQPDAVTGIPSVFASGQGGLLDVSLHPDFSENNLVYLTYASGNDDANRTTLARGQFNEGALTGVEVLFETNVAKTGNQHFGSRLAWLPDGTLLMSVADGGNYIRFDGEWIREQAQNTTNHLGTVVHLTDEGKPVRASAATNTARSDEPSTSSVTTENSPSPDGNQPESAHSRGTSNMYASTPDTATPTLPEIWTYGHRNIQGLTVDPVTGNVWASEHGARGGDELNLLTPGSNYGWPEATYSREYHYPRITRTTTKPGLHDPLIVWTPAQAPSGLTVYYGDAFPDWQGNLFSGGLVTGEVRRIVLNGSTIAGEEKLTIGARVRDVRQGPDGHLYVLTDEANGRLLRIMPGSNEEK